jgi:hypothetical protein
VDAVQKSVAKLVAERYLIREDGEAVIEEAKRADVP